MGYTWATFYSEALEVFALINYFIDSIPDIVLYAIFIGVPVTVVTAIYTWIKGVRSGD